MRTTTWADFARSKPALAEAGARLLYAGRPIATAFLATVSPRNTPRLHPVSPLLVRGELWLFVVEMSPKYRDLVANRRFALHAQLPADGGEEFAVQGMAERVDDADLRANVVTASAGQQGTHVFEQLFRCRIATALHTRWDGWGTAAAWPTFTKWRA